MKQEICKDNRPINELFIQAIRNNSIPQIKWTLEQGADLHYHEDMALDTATTFKHLDVLIFLVKEAGLDPKSNFRCLRDAAQANDLEMMKFLVETCGVDVTLKDNCAMNCAVVRDSYDAMLYLEKKGAPYDLTEVSAPAIKSKGTKTFKQSILAKNAWVFNSLECMPEILKYNKKLFFSDANVKANMTAQEIVLKLDKNPSFVNYVIKELLQYKPEKIELIKSSRNTLTEESKQKQFDAWLAWLSLEIQLEHKSESSMKRKI